MKRSESQKLLDKAISVEEKDEDLAIEIYLEIIAKDPSWSIPYYNLGLIYKYRNQWSKSYKYNRSATEFDKEYQAAWWNLGIASTALKNWSEARRAWLAFGIKLEDTEGEVVMDIGSTPIRLKNGEVVWANRLCPARAIIENVPLKDSGHRYFDLILNDGAPTGKRIYDGREYSVFDELEIIEASDYLTFSIGVIVDNEKAIEKLNDLCDASLFGFENWTNSIQLLCKQCSEGIPHENHDSNLEDKNFDAELNLGIATKSREELDIVLGKWIDQNSNVKVNWVD